MKPNPPVIKTVGVNLKATVQEKVLFLFVVLGEVNVPGVPVQPYPHRVNPEPLVCLSHFVPPYPFASLTLIIYTLYFLLSTLWGGNLGNPPRRWKCYISNMQRRQIESQQSPKPRFFTPFISRLWHMDGSPFTNEEYRARGLTPPSQEQQKKWASEDSFQDI